jgi:hypothetical protein
MILRTIVNWGWSPILITALAVIGYMYEWPLEILAPVLAIILVIGLGLMAAGVRGKEMDRSVSRLKQLAGYFSRRFAGNSSLSIFIIIDSLFKVDNPKVWDWARTCDVAQRIFNTWCDSFISRVESDVRTGRFGLYLRTYLDELWSINNHYYEFVEQFYEVAEKVETPPETIAQYNRFVVEYNAFVQNFQDGICELKKVARTEIEPPSVKLAKELYYVSGFWAPGKFLISLPHLIPLSPS